MTTEAVDRGGRKNLGTARLMAGLLAGVTVPFLWAADIQRRSLNLEERVAAQRAIEQVYWNHRIWPKENPAPKPALSAVLPDRAIRARVEDYLKKSSALETYWRRPITAKQLQAELDRMVTHTRAPQVLSELFAALGSDPFLIAETLARQTLSDRLVRNWYASDERFHGELKGRATAALSACSSVGCMPSLGGEYREISWKLRSEGPEGPEREQHEDVIRLEAEEWRSHLALLARTLGGLPEALPLLKLSGLEETAEAFVVTAVLSQAKDEVRTATVTWPKVSFDEWWAKERATTPVQIEDSPQLFTLLATPSLACVADSWSPTEDEVLPTGRFRHTAVWTGTEMIVWGGYTSSGALNSGGRYDPSTDTWTPTSRGANVPVGRAGHTAVWTGTEMIVWGGVRNEGGRYDPSTDTRTPTSTGADVPAGRYFHTAVWTGTEMIVWGGNDYSDDSFLNTGGRYDPSTDTWTPTSMGTNVPAARSHQTAVWTGTEMIVWGGTPDFYCSLNTGGRYDPSTDTWMPTSMGANVPVESVSHTAVWTGTEMIVWGGSLTTGGRYDPSTDTWAPTSTGANVPTTRSEHTAVWTGTEMIVWGGYSTNTGGRYDPSTDTWTPTSTGADVPTGRYAHTAVWTGKEMIVWGGYDGGGYPVTGGRYDPSTDTWTPTSTGVNVPAERLGHTAVWTGMEMIVWGGYDGGGYPVAGGRYDASTDTWTPTATGADVPAGRSYPTAVWTGTEMIVWGGYNGSALNTGGHYDPSTDTWSPTSTGANVPAARYFHTAVWTGTEMIVWGGYNGSALNTGGHYDPSTDTWSPTSTGANVPAGRFWHTAVWTGREMIVWGGRNGSDGSALNTGGHYDPSTDTWTPTSTGANVPAARYSHSAVWTGTEMIVWGGYTGAARINTGGRYDPSTDTWTPTSTGANVPAERLGHTAVWTGTVMIVWSGDDRRGYSATGGLYCACPSGTLYYRDADGDGYGDASVAWTSCDGTIPAGYVANRVDCNDASASVNPGAAEVCNNVDDDCDGTIDNAAAPGPFNSVTLRSDEPVVEWTPVAAAQAYDVVFGDLGLLHSSGGDFTAATLACVADGTTSTSANFSVLPEVGTGFWILVRGDNCAGDGTYDSGDPAQVGSRDAEIEASPLSCGFQSACGDGTCNGTETCSSCPGDCGVCPPPACGDGTCNGTETCLSCPADCAAVYFDDDFSDNSAGWILGTEWQIGPAQPSFCGDYGGDDPDTDHSVTSDDGVAGVVLGGCAWTGLNPYYYLESPPFDTSTATAGVLLSFYRWLNSDHPPFMTNDIEVWNGSQWVAVWTSSDIILDSISAGGPGWNLNQFDLTPYKNAAMKIRFGFTIEDPWVSPTGSWNIDDVRVSAVSCP